MRLFIAIHPDPGWIRHLTGCQHQLVQAGLQGRLVPRENLHMTLAFAGNCTQDQKDTILETGATVQVPLFINQNEIIKIDTRTGEYLGRAKEA